MSNNMNELIGMAIGLLIIVVVAYLGPGIGEQVSTAMPINQSGDFADATSGADIWTNGFAIMGVVVTVIIVGAAIRTLKGLGGNREE